MQALATLLALFNPVCNLDEYEVSYTNSSLPQSIAFNTALHDLIPISDHAEEDFAQWYERGLEECNAFLDTKPFQKKQQVSPLFNSAESEVAGTSTCRGSRLLYDITGLLVWPFGPIGDCQTHSRCWFGLLTCGSFLEDQFQTTFALPSRQRDSRKWKGWSMGALHVDMSVSGREIVAPRVRHTEFPTPGRHRGSASSPRATTSVLLADYVLTVDGDYSVELGLLGLYPGVLYTTGGGHQTDSSLRRRLLENTKLGSNKPRPHQGAHPKPQHHKDKGISSNVKTVVENSKKSQEKKKSKLKFKDPKQIDHPQSMELLKSVFLGGCEKRSGGKAYCTADCKAQAQVGRSPYRGQAHLRSRESQPESCASVATSEQLPVCTGGNHPGRYLRLPQSLLKHCSTGKYSKLLQEERARQFGKRQYFDKYDAVEYAYFSHAQTVSMEPVMAELNTKARSSGGGSGGHSDHVYYRELLRYLDTENICLLVDIGLSRKLADSRAEIYAPYSCKYRIYDWKKAKKCYKEERGLAMFHGDSMNRALFGMM